MLARPPSRRSIPPASGQGRAQVRQDLAPSAGVIGRRLFRGKALVYQDHLGARIHGHEVDADPCRPIQVRGLPGKDQLPWAVHSLVGAGVQNRLISEDHVDAERASLPQIEVRAKAAETRRDLSLAARRAGTLSPLGNGGRGDREPMKVRDGTINGDFRWLSSVFNFGWKHKVDSRRLISDNPLHDIEVPKERNPLPPVASHQRCLATMGHVDTVDPMGRLRAIFSLARRTGWRESAICELRADDILLSPDRVRAAPAGAGMDELLVEHMPSGAIRWREATDKAGCLFISPISKAARKARDA